jgi:hypothetical protein
MCAKCGKESDFIVLRPSISSEPICIGCADAGVAASQKPKMLTPCSKCGTTTETRYADANGDPFCADCYRAEEQARLDGAREAMTTEIGKQFSEQQNQ